jgi:hypothetical protein
MGRRDLTTTLVYADFAPDPAGGAAFAERAFGQVTHILAAQQKDLSAREPEKKDLWTSGCPTIVMPVQ